VGAKGRIAQVLAQARATLKEPSRPITPASLDARTNLDLKIGLAPDRSAQSRVEQLYRRRGKPKLSQLHSGHASAGVTSFPDAFQDGRDTHEDEGEDSIEVDDYAPVTIRERTEEQTLRQLTESSNLLSCDLTDLLDSSDHNNRHSVRATEKRISDVVQKLTSIADTFGGYLKGDTGSIDAAAMKAAAMNMSSALLHIARNAFLRRTLRQQACRNILKLNLACLHDTSQPLDKQVTSFLLQTSHAMYQLHTEIGM
jgi:hypothetical protein